MTNKERVSNNLQITVDGIKSEKVQEVVTSLAIIAQCQIDINFTLAKMLDEMQIETSTRESGLHWIERFDDTNKWLECPYCHMDSAEAYNYCPNCGAEMKGEEQ